MYFESKNGVLIIRTQGHWMEGADESTGLGVLFVMQLFVCPVTPLPAAKMFYNTFPYLKSKVSVCQCDQIVRFIGLWATFKAFGNN